MSSHANNQHGSSPPYRGDDPHPTRTPRPVDEHLKVFTTRTGSSRPFRVPRFQYEKIARLEQVLGRRGLIFRHSGARGPARYEEFRCLAMTPAWPWTTVAASTAVPWLTTLWKNGTSFASSRRHTSAHISRRAPAAPAMGNVGPTSVGRRALNTLRTNSPPGGPAKRRSIHAGTTARRPGIEASDRGRCGPPAGSMRSG
jgi:hypothetical protein